MKEFIELGAKDVRVRIVSQHKVRGAEPELPLEPTMGATVYTGVPLERIDSLFDEKNDRIDAAYYNIADQVEDMEPETAETAETAQTANTPAEAEPPFGDELDELANRLGEKGFTLPDEDAMQSSIEMIKRIEEGYDPAKDDSFNDESSNDTFCDIGNVAERAGFVLEQVKDLKDQFEKMMREMAAKRLFNIEGKDGADGLDENDPDTAVYEVEGKLSLLVSHDGKYKYVLKYNENESLGGAGTTMTFCPTSPDKITIKRDGELSHMMTLEKNNRRYTAYPTPFGTMTLATLLRRSSCDMSYTNGGTLYLDYLVEIRGTDAQRTKMKLTVM